MKIINEIDPQFAKSIIESISIGVPPEIGLGYFSTGLEKITKAIETDYLSSYLRIGGSSFKLIIGNYGSGKTHFLLSLRELAWKYNFVTSYIQFDEIKYPISDFMSIYKKIVENLSFQLLGNYNLSYDTNTGIESIIRLWFFKMKEILQQKSPNEDIKDLLINYVDELFGDYSDFEIESFPIALKEMFKTLRYSDNWKQLEYFNKLLDWIKWNYKYKRDIPSDLKQKKIDKKITNRLAPLLLKDLFTWIRMISFSGIIILIDEVEITDLRIGKNRNEKYNAFVGNLRQIIDSCADNSFNNSMWFYAIPGMNSLKIDEGLEYQALFQRLNHYSDEDLLHLGVKIELENLYKDQFEIADNYCKKVIQIYKIAYSISTEDFGSDIVTLILDNHIYSDHLFRDIGKKLLFGLNWLRFCNSIPTYENIELQTIDENQLSFSKDLKRKIKENVYQSVYEKTQNNAIKLIKDLLSREDLIEFGINHFTVKLDMILNSIIVNYFSSFIKEGGSAFKIVLGNENTGKSHFLLSLQEIGLKNKSMTAYIMLDEGIDSFDNMNNIFVEIISYLTLFDPESEENQIFQGIAEIIEYWFFKVKEGIRTARGYTNGTRLNLALNKYISFLNNWDFFIADFRKAIQASLKSLLDNDDEGLELLIKWFLSKELTNDEKEQLNTDYNIKTLIQDHNGFLLIKDLLLWIRNMNIDYNSLIILIDQEISSRKARYNPNAINNFRNIIDSCKLPLNKGFQNSMWFLASHSNLLSQYESGVYNALTQRLESNFLPNLNPQGMKIILKDTDDSLRKKIISIGNKIFDMYNIANGNKFDPMLINFKEDLNRIAEEKVGERFSNNRPLSVAIDEILKLFIPLE